MKHDLDRDLYNADDADRDLSQLYIFFRHFFPSKVPKGLLFDGGAVLRAYGKSPQTINVGGGGHTHSLLALFT